MPAMLNRLLLRGAVWTAALLVALIFIVLAAVFMCSAIYFHFSTFLSRSAAALATAGIAVAIAIFVMLLGWAVSALSSASSRAPAQPPPKAARARRGGTLEDQFAAELGNKIGQDFAQFTKEHTFQAMLVSLAGGFAVGASPKLRGFLMGLLKF
jgi:hypothetical protein